MADPAVNLTKAQRAALRGKSVSEAETFHCEMNGWLFDLGEPDATVDEAQRCREFGASPKDAAGIVHQERAEQKQHEAREERIRKAVAIDPVPDDVAEVALKQFRRERQGLSGEVLDIMERAILADRATRSVAEAQSLCDGIAEVLFDQNLSGVTWEEAKNRVKSVKGDDASFVGHFASQALEDAEAVIRYLSARVSSPLGPS